jgi:DNA-binding CsgD family transcriptional regulator
MSPDLRRPRRFRPDKLADFLDAAYQIDQDDPSWLAEVMEAGRAVWGEAAPVHGGIYDASDVTAFRMTTVQILDVPAAGVEFLMEQLKWITPDWVTRSFRKLLVDETSTIDEPESVRLLEGLRRLGFHDTLNINGLDPSGRSAMFMVWKRTPSNISPGEWICYRRMAHHLAAACRLRRRLNHGSSTAGPPDLTHGAEAVLDSRGRIIHASGEATSRAARQELSEASKARDRARTHTAAAQHGLRRWRPLTSARWTLVDTFERSGTRYIVARENQTEARGLTLLSDRERQVVTYLATGQSTKEIAYALGISAVTVRVLLARAMAKIGVESRSDLLRRLERSPFTKRE